MTQTLGETLADAVREAARRYGTPLYLYDIERLRADARAVREAFPEPWLALYALKANGLPALVRELPGLGFGATAVSGGELALASRAGFAESRTALEGIGKTPADLARIVALAAEGRPLLWTSLESADEATELARLAMAARRRRGASGLRLDVLVRINPQVRPETEAGLAVGAVGSKFGVLVEELPDVVAAGGGPDGPLRWRGIHVHVGSQLGAVDAWRSGLRVALAVLGLQRAALPDFDTLDAGSGFPVGDDLDAGLPSLRHFAGAAADVLDELPVGARPARLAIEPGRTIVGRAGWLVARVLHVREREPRQVVLDAGMTELIRPALYGARHPLAAITSLGREADGTEPLTEVVVDGPICESTDRLARQELPPLRRGDLVAIGLAGAYAAAMASTYNGRPRPVELAWDAGRVVVLRRRERIAQLP